MLNTYVVEGGVGKCTAFTALLPKLKKKSEVQVYTPYIDCFAGNPDVKLALESTLPLQDPRIMASDNIYFCEPYKSNFQFGKQHIIESYCEHHGVDFNRSMRPKIYTDQHKASVTKWLADNKIGKYIMIQFSGGQAKWNYGENVQYQNINPNRNYQPYLKGSEGFISIDSCLQHFSASAEKHGVVIWGSTRWTQFGYSHNKNLHFYMKDKWDEAKFNDSDPRNNMVEPKLVIDNFKKLDKNKTVACATI
jgi:hypothetical protein